MYRRKYEAIERGGQWGILNTVIEEFMALGAGAHWERLAKRWVEEWNEELDSETLAGTCATTTIG